LLADNRGTVTSSSLVCSLTISKSKQIQNPI
jgi:hypothetical protein